jgi:hypothetical protein
MIALVSLEAARSVLGLTAEKVFALVDDGSLLWVFNLGAVKSPKRNLCFWQPTEMPKTCMMLTRLKAARGTRKVPELTYHALDSHWCQ